MITKVNRELKLAVVMVLAVTLNELYAERDDELIYENELYEPIRAVGFSSPLVVIIYTNHELELYKNITPVMYTDSTGTNIFRDIWNDVLKPIGNAAAAAGRFLGGLGITVVAGVATVITAPFFLIPGVAVVPQFLANMTVYGGALMASSWDSTINSDLKLIGYNPFNTNASAAVQSQKISFYKGAAVVRFSPKFLTSFSFGMIFLERGESAETLKHEWGHAVQFAMLGVIGFTGLVAIPSMACNLLARRYNWFYDNYYNMPWESTADWFGGVRR